MNREQAKAIVKNFALIKHFAEGGDIGHRLITAKGEQAYISPSKSICLSNMHPDKHCLYVAVKPKMKWNPQLQVYERKTRRWPEKIREEELIELEEKK